MANSTKSIRALHWVLKIGHRSSNVEFFRKILGMNAVRHEEFEKGCEASCNGPYAGKWSKTMIGYGTEDSHFVLELTYNYEISSYNFCNDFRGIMISSRAVSDLVKNSGYKFERVLRDGNKEELLKILSPDGYPFFIRDDGEVTIVDIDPVRQISISVSNLESSVNFWSNQVGLLVAEKFEGRARLVCGADIVLELVENDDRQQIDHGTAFGRIAFAVPATSLRSIEEDIKNSEGGKILTPLISLDTPGKAAVQVVIASDPDGYEICFVGDEAFRKLSKFDENADKLLDDAILKDKSDEWFQKKGKSKLSAPAADDSKNN